MIVKRLFLSVTLILAGLLLASCGGSSPAWPDAKDGTRILGVDFGKKVPSLIAFSRTFETTNGPTRDLFVMFPDGSHEKRLTNHNADDDYPAFSPNGLAMAFVSNRSGPGWGNHDVYRLDSPGKISRLTSYNWEFDSSATDWAPGYITAAQHNTLIMAPFDVIRLQGISPIGKWEQTVTTGFVANYDPCVSRDGKMIAFCARPNCPGEDDPGCMGTLQLFLLKKGETTPVQLTDFGGDPLDPILIRHPAFDFAQTRIVFQTTYWGDNWDIGYIRLGDGAAPELFRLTDDPADDVEPCFDPSGLWIAFATNRDGNFEIYKTWDPYNPLGMPAPAEPTVRLTYTAQDESNPDWSPLY